MTDQKRDESKDCFVVTRFGKPLRVYGIETQVIDSPDGSEDCGHYVPHSDLVAAEQTIAEQKARIEELEKAMIDAMGQTRIDSICILRKALDG